MTSHDAATAPPRSAALRALLADLIDYAGLFPPAALDLSAVIANFAQYRDHRDAWMLARLIIPVAQLDAFETLAREHLPSAPDSEPWPISALVRSAALGDLEPAIDRIESFNDHHADAAHGRAVIETIELKADAAAHIDAALDVIPDAIYPFFEIPVDTDPRGLLAALPGSEAGAKIRTGGVTPELYPQPPHVARFVRACAAANVPFKATAGLHHPLRHHNPAVPADEFGFLNVFFAACAAHHHDLDDAALLELLTETDSSAFTVTDEAITWRDITLDAASIDDSRSTFAISFGSCSFDEPRDDLRAMQLLP